MNYKEFKIKGKFLPSKGLNFYLNPQVAFMMSKNSNLKSIYKIAENVYLDGILLVWIFKLISKKSYKRLSPDFSSYMHDLLSHVKKSKLRLAVIGGGPHEINNFCDKVERINSINIQLSKDGYFDSDEDVIKNVIEKNIDVLLLGLGTPKQEVLASELVFQYSNIEVYTCGAFISQEAQKTDNENYYPNWIDKLNLRFLYRIYKNPKLIKRYTYNYFFGIKYLLK